jgi:hypothetical protein
VQINVPTDHGKSLFIIGTVVRVETYGPKKYDIGIAISFLEMDQAMKNEISRWLQLRRQNEKIDIEQVDQ